MTDKLVERLLHPTLGVKRGIIDFTEQGKGGRDPDDKLLSMTVGECREIYAALQSQSLLINEAVEALEPFARTINFDPCKERGERHWATYGSPSNIDDVLRAQIILAKLKGQQQ